MGISWTGKFIWRLLPARVLEFVTESGAVPPKSADTPNNGVQREIPFRLTVCADIEDLELFHTGARPIDLPDVKGYFRETEWRRLLGGGTGLEGVRNGSNSAMKSDKILPLV
jgi:hypothetical protein